MQEILAAVIYKNADLINKVRQEADNKFKENSYVKNLWILKEYKRRGGKVSYKGEKPSNKTIKKQVSASVEDSILEMVDEWEDSEAAKNEGKTLNKPFRLPSGSNKKFGVYVKNDKGNVVMVKFGDPNMEIKRDDPTRRKNFRSRHNCDNPGPKWKARWWSCKKGWGPKPVSETIGSQTTFSLEEEFDFENLPSQEEILALDPSLALIAEVDECDCEDCL